MKRAKSVDAYYRDAPYWQPELCRLREILVATTLTETLKWSAPCYTWQGRNVVGIGGFKSYFGLWFFDGALLEDASGVLINAQQGKTRALRQWRMHSATDLKPVIVRRYVREAIAVVDAGRSIVPDRGRPIVVPEELRTALADHDGAARAFRGLREGLQREYADYVADAKRDSTRARRVEKILPMILDGVGLNDKYR